MNRDDLMAELVERYTVNAVPSEEFNGNGGGIWLRDDVWGKLSYDADDTLNDDHVFNAYLKAAGWFAEPYDSETIFLYPL